MSHGDREAFETLYHRYCYQLLDAAYKRLENMQQAEDIVQEIFIKFWLKREEHEIKNLRAWLFTAVRYSVLTYIVRHKAPISFYEPFEMILLEGDTPDEQLIAKDLLELIYAYGQLLPEILVTGFRQTLIYFQKPNSQMNQ